MNPRALSFLFSLIFVCFTPQLSSAQGRAVYNQLRNAPPAFAVDGGQAIFVDFQEARYHIIIDTNTRTVTAESRIVFSSDKPGFPVFDLVDEPFDVRLDDQPVSQRLVRVPDNATKVRVVLKAVAPGQHTLQLRHKLTAGFQFDSGGASVGFFMDDLSERGFLERYLPSNLDYDQFKILFKVEYVGPHREPEFFTNGRVTTQNPHSWLIEFPPYFNTSAVYFHTAIKGAFRVDRWLYPSVDGRQLPVTVYGQPNSAVVKSVLAELEKDYGPFRHPSVTVYHANVSGGMEYCGATMTQPSAYVTGHELMHSYFARGMMPAGGNAGWIDEAIASWRDRGYRTLTRPGFESSGMAAHSVYQRATDDAAYTKGEAFIAYLNSLTSGRGGMKSFLNQLLKDWLFRPMTTADFENELTQFAGRSFEQEFKKYVYGQDESGRFIPNPVHHRLTREDVRRLVRGDF